MTTVGWIFILVLVAVASFVAGCVTAMVLAFNAAKAHAAARQEAARKLAEAARAAKCSRRPVPVDPGGAN